MLFKYDASNILVTPLRISCFFFHALQQSLGDNNKVNKIKITIRRQGENDGKLYIRPLFHGDLSFSRMAYNSGVYIH